jgi:uncharacterized protein (UPF0262 family)
MRRIFIIIFGIILLFGCSTIGGMREKTGNFVKVVDLNLGISWENSKVVKLDKESPAERAGVKIGDIFVSSSFKGEKITSQKEYDSLIFKMQLGDHILYVMDRDGKQIKFKITPNESKVKMLPTQLKIASLLILENKTVNLAVIVSQVKNTYGVASHDWYDAMRGSLQSQCEEVMIGDFGNHKNFSVVDRSRLKQILDEFRFSSSGFVSDKLRTKIGEMTGATHIEEISFTRYKTSLGSEDRSTNRLIDIESGKVLAVDIGSTY